jgi:hypothetical protein
MGTEGSLPANCPYPEPAKSSPYRPIPLPEVLTVNHNIIVLGYNNTRL